MKLPFTASLLRLGAAAVLLLAGTLAQAAAMTVTIWEPFPGKSQLMLEHAQAAKAIQEKLGAQVLLGMENTGRLHYALGGFENWQAWAAFIEKLQASKDWAAWQADVGANPAARQEENFLLNVLPGSEPVESGFYQVFIWEPRNGRTGDLVDAAMQAKAIHEKAGVSVGINVDQMQRVHYVMDYRDIGHWAKVQDTPNPEFQAFMEKQSQNPTGDLIEVYTASPIP